MELNEAFEKAVADSKTLPAKPSNEVLLNLYSLYKQATQGDADEDRPFNAFDIVAHAKYNAWVKLRGKKTETAMQEYVDLVNGLKAS